MIAPVIIAIIIARYGFNPKLEITIAPIIPANPAVAPAERSINPAIKHTIWPKETIPTNAAARVITAILLILANLGAAIPLQLIKVIKRKRELLLVIEKLS